MPAGKKNELIYLSSKDVQGDFDMSKTVSLTLLPIFSDCEVNLRVFLNFARKLTSATAAGKRPYIYIYTYIHVRKFQHKSIQDTTTFAMNLLKSTSESGYNTLFYFSHSCQQKMYFEHHSLEACLPVV